MKSFQEYHLNENKNFQDQDLEIALINDVSEVLNKAGIFVEKISFNSFEHDAEWYVPTFYAEVNEVNYSNRVIAEFFNEKAAEDFIEALISNDAHCILIGRKGAEGIVRISKGDKRLSWGNIRTLAEFYDVKIDTNSLLAKYDFLYRHPELHSVAKNWKPEDTIESFSERYRGKIAGKKFGL